MKKTAPAALRRRLVRTALAFGLAAGCAAALLAWRTPVSHAASTAAVSALGPLASFALPESDRVRFEGRVVERLDAGSYIYLAVEREDGTRAWAVTLSSSRGAKPGVGRVRVTGFGHADNFSSKRLGRVFDSLYFATIAPA